MDAHSHPFRWGCYLLLLLIPRLLGATDIQYEAEDNAPGNSQFCFGYRSAAAWFDEPGSLYPGASNSKVHSTVTQNARADISFGGSGIELVFYKFSNGGTLGYKLDDAASFTTISTYATTPQRIVLTIAARGTLQSTLHKLTVQKMDASGSGLVLDCVRVLDDQRVRYEEGALAYFPTATWQSDPGVWDEDYAFTGASNGQLFYTMNSTVPARCRLNFTGTAVSLIRCLRSDYGSYSWDIDNGLLTGSETMNATQLGSDIDIRVPKILATGLPNTVHTLTLTCTSGLIVFDAVDAFQQALQAGHYEVEDNDPNLTYYPWGFMGESTWVNDGNASNWPGASGGAARYTYTPGAGAELVFCGTGVTLNYFTYPNGTSFTWQIDGGPLNTVNTYAAVPQLTALACAAQGSLVNTVHRLTIRHSGTYGAVIALDSADVKDDNFQRIEQNRFLFGGTGWSKCADDPDASDRALCYHTGATTGDIIYKFFGTGVSVSSYVAASYGSFNWSIDGGVRSGTVNLNSPRSGYDVRIPQVLANDLSYGWHTLALTASGTVCIDAIDVAKGGAQPAWSKYLLVVDYDSISSGQQRAVDSFRRRVRELSKSDIQVRSNATLSAADKLNYNLIVVGSKTQNALLNTLLGSTLTAEFGSRPGWIQEQSYLVQSYPGYFAAGKKVIAAGSLGDLGGIYAIGDLEKKLAGEDAATDLHDVNVSLVYDQGAADAYYYPAWSTDTQPAYYGGSGAYTSTGGSLVSLLFAGTEVSLIYRKVANYGIANYYIDGTFLGTIDMYGTGDTSRVTQKLATGLADGLHSLVIEHSGTHNASASAPYYITIDGFKVNGSQKIRVEEAALTASSGWSSTSDSNASGGTLKSTSTAGAYLETTFSGTDVAVIYRAMTSSGSFNWSIDGGAYSGTFNTSAGATVNRKQAVLITGLSQGAHTLRITRASGTIYIDAVDYRARPYRVEDPELERRAEYLNIPAGYRAYSVAPEMWSRDEWHEYIDNLVLARKTHLYFYLWYADLYYRFAASSWGDRIAQQNHVYLRDAIDYARSRGLKVIYMFAPTTVPIDTYNDSANVALRAGGSYNPYPGMPRFNPSVALACSYMQDVYTNEIEWFKNADGIHIWFYDPGGCFCSLCSQTNMEHLPLAWQVKDFDYRSGARNPAMGIEMNIWPHWAIEPEWGHTFATNLRSKIKLDYGSMIGEVTFSDTAGNETNARTHMTNARLDGYRTMGFHFETNIESTYPFLTPFVYPGNEIYSQLLAMKNDQHTGTYVHRIESSRMPQTQILQNWEWDLSLDRWEVLRRYASEVVGDGKPELDVAVALAMLDTEVYTSGLTSYGTMATAMNEAFNALSGIGQWRLRLLYDTKNAIYYICANDLTSFNQAMSQSSFFFDYHARFIGSTMFSQYRTWLNSGWASTRF